MYTHLWIQMLDYMSSDGFAQWNKHTVDTCPLSIAKSMVGFGNICASKLGDSFTCLNCFGRTSSDENEYAILNKK